MESKDARRSSFRPLRKVLLKWNIINKNPNGSTEFSLVLPH